MAGPVDLDAYFERIGWGGDTRPTYDTLVGLLNAHMLAIPFENLDVLLGQGIRLDLDSVQAKLIAARRGGYCFEHVTLFAAVLEELGFELVRHTARVTLFVPRTQAPRTHMFLTVPLAEGTFVADPGFGGYGPRVPLIVPADGEVGDDSESHWFARDGRFWVLKMRDGDKVADAWSSTLEPDNLIDFDLGNHYTATYPASPFVNRLMLLARTVDVRVSAMNRDVTVVKGDHRETSQLASRQDLRRLLVQYFGFDLPEVEQIRVPSIPEWG